MSGLTELRHLARRFVGSLSRRPPPAADLEWVTGQLSEAERTLWLQFGAPDQRHSIEVARRFVELRPDATREEIAGALLHDIGKLDSGLGTIRRVVATVVGPRTDRFRRYHDHERIGGEWLASLGSDPVTVALVAGTAETSAATALAAADAR